MTSTRSGHQEKTSGQQIERGPAEHLALEPLQAVDVPFDRALTPGQCHRRLDGGQVRPEPCGQAPEGRKDALSGAGQPWGEPCRLALAEDAGELLRKGHGFRQGARVVEVPGVQVERCGFG